MCPSPWPAILRRSADIPEGYAISTPSRRGNWVHSNVSGALSQLALFQFPFPKGRDRFDDGQRPVRLLLRGDLGRHARVSGRENSPRRYQAGVFWAPVSARHFSISVSTCQRPVRYVTETGSHKPHNRRYRDDRGTARCVSRSRHSRRTAVPPFDRGALEVTEAQPARCF